MAEELAGTKCVVKSLISGQSQRHTRLSRPHKDTALHWVSHPGGSDWSESRSEGAPFGGAFGHSPWAPCLSCPLPHLRPPPPGLLPPASFRVCTGDTAGCSCPQGPARLKLVLVTGLSVHPSCQGWRTGGALAGNALSSSALPLTERSVWELRAGGRDGPWLLWAGGGLTAGLSV